MKTDLYGNEVVPCRLCGNDTAMLGTKLCDRCWELEGRMKRDTWLAIKIMESFGYKVHAGDAASCNTAGGSQ